MGYVPGPGTATRVFEVCGLCFELPKLNLAADF